jgi:hypothetical protein
MTKPPSPSVASRAVPTAVPLWAWMMVALALFSLYVLSYENGALLSANGAALLHELTHDARHALGVPCH